MNNLKSTTELVKIILDQDERARNSDSYLYMKVIRIIAERKGMEISNVSIYRFLLMMDVWGFPPFESVRRVRQKVQATFPELAATNKTRKNRKKNEAAFHKYAKEIIEI